jgi:hypothetical protein
MNNVTSFRTRTPAHAASAKPIDITLDEERALESVRQQSAYYGNRFQANVGELIPSDRLASLRCQIEESLIPAPPGYAALAVAILAGALKFSNAVEDRSAYVAAMIAHLENRYPHDVLEAAAWQAVEELEWFPATSEMIAICNVLAYPRRQLLSSVDQMEDVARRLHAEAEQQARLEADRTERDAQKAEHEAQQERERRDKIAQVEAALTAEFGDAAPLPGDIELVDNLIDDRFADLMARDQPWFDEKTRSEIRTQRVTCCRKQALLARLMQKGVFGGPMLDEIGDLILANEAAARRQIDSIAPDPAAAERLAAAKDLHRRRSRNPGAAEFRGVRDGYEDIVKWLRIITESIALGGPLEQHALRAHQAKGETTAAA